MCRPYGHWRYPKWPRLCVSDKYWHVSVSVFAPYRSRENGSSHKWTPCTCRKHPYRSLKRRTAVCCLSLPFNLHTFGQFSFQTPADGKRTRFYNTETMERVTFFFKRNVEFWSTRATYEELTSNNFAKWAWTDPNAMFSDGAFVADNGSFSLMRHFHTHEGAAVRDTLRCVHRRGPFCVWVDVRAWRISMRGAEGLVIGLCCSVRWLKRG